MNPFENFLQWLGFMEQEPDTPQQPNINAAIARLRGEPTQPDQMQMMSQMGSKKAKGKQSALQQAILPPKPAMMQSPALAERNPMGSGLSPEAELQLMMLRQMFTGPQDFVQ